MSRTDQKLLALHTDHSHAKQYPEIVEKLRLSLKSHGHPISTTVLSRYLPVALEKPSIIKGVPVAPLVAGLAGLLLALITPIRTSPPNPALEHLSPDLYGTQIMKPISFSHPSFHQISPSHELDSTQQSHALTRLSRSKRLKEIKE